MGRAVSDHRGAATFAIFFRALADGIDEAPSDVVTDRLNIARVVWQRSASHDFSNLDLRCDAALVALGLAWREPDPEYPDEQRTVYADHGGTRE